MEQGAVGMLPRPGHNRYTCKAAIMIWPVIYNRAIHNIVSFLPPKKRVPVPVLIIKLCCDFGK